MPRVTLATIRSGFRIALLVVWGATLSGRAYAQDPPPPAYIAVVEGVAMLERNGESEPAVRDMPFVEGDRLRTENGRVEIEFPDGTAIEVGPYSLVEAMTPTRVRLLAGTMEHLQRASAGAPQQLAVSASYLPQDLRGYGGTFDRYGSWQYAAPYGYVWYPTVAAGWRPYHYGRWSSVPAYGWTWVGIDPWSYPTHHYGRWGFARNAWFWIPGRTWGAAWVSWGAAPDYVSWCPLGLDNRPVFALSVTSYDTWHRGGGAWFGWTVVPRSHFGGPGYYAHRYAVEPRSLPSDTPFIVSSRPPVGLPHQSAGAGRQPPSASRQSSIASRQSPLDNRDLAVPRRPAAAGTSASVTQPGADGRTASPRGEYGVPRRYRPGEESAASGGDVRTPATGFGVPRRSYPGESPFAAAQGKPFDKARARPLDGAPGRPIDRAQYRREAIERPRYGAPASATPIVVPEYRSPGRAVPSGQPQRWNQSQVAAPASPNVAPEYRSPGRPVSPAQPLWNPYRTESRVPAAAPVQRAPAAGLRGAPVQAPAPAPVPPQPSHADAGARSAPAGATHEGAAQPRTAGQGASAGSSRRR
jgi:Family of unknown function (DUF6600)